MADTAWVPSDGVAQESSQVRVQPEYDGVARFVRCEHCNLPHGADERRCPIAGRTITPIDCLGEATSEVRDVFELLGTLVGERYRIFDVLGCGGMGAVYEAIDVVEGRLVAIKVMRRSRITDDHALRRFLREGTTTERLDHPRIVRHHAAGELEDGSPFLALELLEGRSLAQELTQRGPLPLDEALAIIEQVLEGLAAAHAAGVVHRDIKPDNLFVEDVLPDEPISVRILDFGVAKLLSPDAPASITSQGKLIGTPHYLAPEQILDPDEVREPADLWAAGVVLFELLTGETPFLAEHLPGLLYEITSVAHASPSSARPELPASVDALLGRLLAKEPSARFASAADALCAVRRLSAQL